MELDLTELLENNRYFYLKKRKEKILMSPCLLYVPNKMNAVAIHESHSAQTLPTIAQRHLHRVYACTCGRGHVCVHVGKPDSF